MTTTTTAAPVSLRAGEGESRWWTGELATIKLTAEDTGGAFGLVEIVAPPNLEIPLHVHHREDETFWILSGSVRFVVAGETIEARDGGVLYAPRAVPHAYTVGPNGCRMLFLFTPGGFEGFVRDSSEPAGAPTPPPAMTFPDEETMAVLGEKYGVELLV